MSPNTCIHYVEETEGCRCRKQPNCPYWHEGECRCKGKIGKKAAHRG